MRRNRGDDGKRNENEEDGMYDGYGNAIVCLSWLCLLLLVMARWVSTVLSLFIYMLFFLV